LIGLVGARAYPGTAGGHVVRLEVTLRCTDEGFWLDLMNQAADRHAATPSEIPWRGWRDIFIRVYRNVETNRVIIVAAGVSFYSLLAIFPAIAAMVAIYGLFADPAAISSHLDSASGLLPGGAIEVIRDQLTRTSSRGTGTLGFTFLGGLAFSLWSANAGIKSIFDALNLVYSEEEKRGFVILNLVSLTFTAAAIVFALTAIVLVIALPIVLDYIGLGEATDLTVRVGRWPLLFLGVAFALAVLYRYGPSRSRPKWRWISWGSAFAAMTWIIASVLFSWYTANFATYDKTYGSLGAVIGFMVWLWISMIVVLVGAAINAEIEHQTALNTIRKAKAVGLTASEANPP
jgi:membrane protein